MLGVVPHTVPRVGRSYAHFPDGFDFHLLPLPSEREKERERERRCGRLCEVPRKVDVRLPGKGNSDSHGARPVHLIITKI